MPWESLESSAYQATLHLEQHNADGSLSMNVMACAGASNMESAEKVEAALDAQAQQQEDEEARQEGHVQAHVYLAYGRAAGWTIMAVSFIIMQVMIYPVTPLSVHCRAAEVCSVQSSCY